MPGKLEEREVKSAKLSESVEYEGEDWVNSATGVKTEVDLSVSEVNKGRRMSSVRVVVKREGTLKSSTTVGLSGGTVVTRKEERRMSSVRVVVKREGILKSSTSVGLSGATVVVRKEGKTMSVVKVEGGWGTLKRTVVSALLLLVLATITN